jgi:hypothetical protein
MSLPDEDLFSEKYHCLMLLILGVKYLHGFNRLGTCAYHVNVNKTSRQFRSASTDVATLSICTTNKLQLLWHLDISILGPL